MTRTFKVLALLLLVATTPPSRAQTPGPAIRDDAGFFSPEAEQKATAVLAEVARARPGRNVLIETFDTLPEGKDLRGYAVERATAAKLTGLYVIIVRKTGQVGVRADRQTARIFTQPVSDQLRDFLIAGMRKGRENFDPTLLEAVASIKGTFDRGAADDRVASTRPGDRAATATAVTRPARSHTDQIFDALSGDVPELRKAAADVLRASAGDRATAEPAVPRLLAMLEGSGAAARAQAADLLGEIGKADADLIKPAIPALVAALRDNASNDLRRAAARALGRAGLAARDAATGPLKSAAENDADAGVRQEATAAVQALGGSEKP